MDGNSYQGYSRGEFDRSNNMYSQLLKAGLTNYTTLEPDDEESITWSVNKIRGPISDQVRKIGDYQLDNIDYSVTSAKMVQVKNADQEEMERSTRDPKYSEKLDDMDKQEIYNKMLPNITNPSDHLPIVVTYEFK